MSNIKINSYFSGAGLLDLGLMESGLEINQAFELDSAACKVYRENLGDHMKECDLTQELASAHSSADVACFTYPCTKYSSIADISGTRDGDSLFLHALRLTVLKQFEMFCVENVPGIKKFPVVMEVLTKLPGYYVKVFCPVQAQLWLPQKRDRVIIIASRKRFNFRPPENNKPVGLASILEKDPDVTCPKAVFNRLNGQYRDLPIISDPDKGDLAPTCVAHYSRDRSTRLVVDKRFDLGVRPYTVTEYARLMGVPDSFSFDSVCKTSAYKQIGNGVPVPIGRWIGGEIKRYFSKSTKSLLNFVNKKPIVQSCEQLSMF